MHSRVPPQTSDEKQAFQGLPTTEKEDRVKAGSLRPADATTNPSAPAPSMMPIEGLEAKTRDAEKQKAEPHFSVVRCSRQDRQVRLRGVPGSSSCLSTSIDVPILVISRNT